MRKGKLRKSGKKRMVEVFSLLVIQTVIFFAAAGRLNIPRAWFWVALGSVHLLFNFILFYTFSPELINVRGEISKETKTWDKIFGGLYVLMVFTMPAVAGLDVGRYGWSDLQLPFMVLGIAFYIVSVILFDWAMIANAYFETTARIQKDKGQKVVSTGPYRIVRHPGYAGIIFLTFATPLILGSAYALIASGIITMLMIYRTFMEDKMLQNELSGYVEYTNKVRYRLVPGLW